MENSRTDVNRSRLLLVNSTLHIGGAEQVAAFLAERIDRRLFDVSACYLKEPGRVAEQMLRAGVDLFPLPGLLGGRRDYFTSLKLRSLIKELGVNIIHTHDLHGLIDGAICRLSTPGLRHVHTFHFGNYPHRRLRHQIVEKTLWRVPDALVAVGHAQAAAISRSYGIPAHRLRILWNGVEDPYETARTGIDCDAPAEVPVIASISTLIPQKGLEHLLDAAALLRQSGEQFFLLIAGDGPLKQTLKQRISALGLERHVQMLGWVPRAAHRVLPACDIFVQSSLWEAMSVVVLEAMAAARPMVVTAVGDNPHVVLDQSTGILVPPGDARTLAEALRGLLRDGLLRARLAQAARKRYLELFTVQHMTSVYQELYLELTSSASARTATATHS
jgi:glycosyltransferase involved in cell wall biosynthesis